jgi:hypothetical protein
MDETIACVEREGRPTVSVNLYYVHLCMSWRPELCSSVAAVRVGMSCDVSDTYLWSVCKCFGMPALQVLSDLPVRNTAPFGPRMASLLEIDPDGD